MAMDAHICPDAGRWGLGLLARVRARDDLHLGPALLSPAAARRVGAGLMAVAAYLRRLIIMLALQMEAGLAPHTRPYVKTGRAPRADLNRDGLRLFMSGQAFPAHAAWIDMAPSHRSGPQCAAPFLARLRVFEALLKAPQARARRLAFYLARRRPGPIAPPGFGRPGLPPRYGTEVSAIYHGLGVAILQAGRARPPPLGPTLRAGPRIRPL